MAAVLPVVPVANTLTGLSPSTAVATPAAQGNFSDILADGLRAVDSKVARADAMVEAFAKGDPIPVHQVTIALEQARLAVELAVQVRTRLVETYRDFMSMQL